MDCVLHGYASGVSTPVSEDGPSGPSDQVVAQDAAQRNALENRVMRAVAVAGVLGVGTALGAILVAADTAGWLAGLGVSIVSLTLAALLRRARY